MRALWPLSVCWVLLALMTSPGAAHVTATGLAIVTIDGSRIGYELTVVPAELPDSTAQTLLAAAAGNRDSAERVSEEMQAAVSVRVNGVACRPGRIAIQGTGSGDGKALLRYVLQCAIAPGLFDLEEDWRGSFGPHYRTIVSMRSAQVSGEYALGEETRRLSVDFGMPAPSGLLGFIRFGIEHILTGYDHLLFLLALLIGATKFWQMLGVATAFTVAHSTTLSLAVLGLMHVPGTIVEPLIAATIVWVAVENMLGERRAWHRAAIAFLFGLVHGLGFADALESMALSGWRLARALLGFNVGVELGQAAAIISMMPLLLWIGRWARGVLVCRLASFAVAATGAWWLVQRVYLG